MELVSLRALAEVIAETPGVVPGLRILLILAIGYPLLRLGVGQLRRAILRKSSVQASQLAGKAVFYIGIIALLSIVLHEMGFNLTAVIGAAGILGVAIGFASQTSLANIISGIFLIGERPFAVGELIQVGDLIGTVIAIDLLSVKVRTPDNRLVRIPNEHLLKGIVTTINRYPIRRLDVRLSVAYKEDVAHVRRVLADVADRHPLCLDEPKPLIIFDKFGDSGLEFLFAVWVVRERFLDLKNGIMDMVKERFDAEGIEIPFPHISLYAGEASQPFPIRVVNDTPSTSVVNPIGGTDPT
ncbi:MAG: mechanosensitive ion channel family protein [Planctomycetota bacterium]|nr:MAG: mechanosensitive ion channel family protein [Planctomycetota bacterium]